MVVMRKFFILSRRATNNHELDRFDLFREPICRYTFNISTFHERDVNHEQLFGYYNTKL